MTPAMIQGLLFRLLTLATLLLAAPHPPPVTGPRLAGETSIRAGRASDTSPFLQRLDTEGGRAGARVDEGPVVGRPTVTSPKRHGPLAATVTAFRPEDAPRRNALQLPGRRIPRMGPVEPPRA